MSTINWDEHWERGEEPEEARAFAIKMAERLTDFMKNKQIARVADFGCGPATTLIELSKIFPHVMFYGFDVSSPAITINQEKAQELQLKNTHFEQNNLPDIKTREKFDLVICFSTLHYIEKIDQAVKELFERVSPGGYMILNYPNVFTLRAFQTDIRPTDEYMRRRFALVFAGKNLTSIRRIEEVLEVKPKKFYSSRKSNIYVSIHKPNR